MKITRMASSDLCMNSLKYSFECLKMDLYTIQPYQNEEKKEN